MRCQISCVEPVLLIHLFCLLLKYPIGQQMVIRKVCLNHFNNTYCDAMSNSNSTNVNDENIVQEEAAMWNVYLSICSLLPALVTTFIYGTLSDVIGRKRVLVIPIIGETLNNVCYLLDAWYRSASLYYLFFGNVITGLCGNFGTVLMCANAYIADTSGKDTRTKRVIILRAMIFIGSIFSYVCGGFILERFGFVEVYCTILFFFGILMIYLCFLKESYQPTGEIKVSKAMFMSKLVDAFKVVFTKRKKYYRMVVFLLFGCLFLLLLLDSGFSAITVLFLKHIPLNFNSLWLGYFQAEVNAMNTIGATLVTLIFVNKYKWNDSSIIVIASLSSIGFMLSLGFASFYWQVFTVAIWYLGVGSGVPATQAALTKMVSQAEQGQMCSFIANMETFCNLISNILFPILYEKTVAITPRFVLYIMAGLSAIALLLSLLLKLFGKRSLPYQVVVGTDNDQVIDSERGSGEYVISE